MTTIAAHYDITKNAPVEIQMKVLTAGFDLGLSALVYPRYSNSGPHRHGTVYTMHPDYQVEDIDKMAAGLV